MNTSHNGTTVIKHSFLLISAALCGYAADLVVDVSTVAARGDYAKASSYIHAFESQHGRTSESILALSVLGRTALAQKKYDLADRYAQDAYQEAQKELTKRALDREPKLPLALGASLEVQSQVLASRGQRTEAVSMLESELRKYANTSIHARIRKNINLISLEGKPAPALEGASLPKGKPVLLFFWAHWCGDCRAEAPILSQIKKEFGPKGLVLIGPTQKYGYIGSENNVPPSIEVTYIEIIRKQYYAQAVDGPATVSERNFLTYGVSTTPTIALVDRNGVVRMYHPGGMKYEELRSAVNRLLQQR
jgi:thiol-disulfide isomerase/thioredoxin